MTTDCLSLCGGSVDDATRPYTKNSGSEVLSQPSPTFFRGLTCLWRLALSSQTTITAG